MSGLLQSQLSAVKAFSLPSVVVQAFPADVEHTAEDESKAESGL